MVDKTHRAELGRQGAEKKQIGVRVDWETYTELQAEADELGLKVATYCRDLIHRQRSGQSLDSLRMEIAELVEMQQIQRERIDTLAIGFFDAFRTLLLNLTDLREGDPRSEAQLEELRRRVLGR